LWVVVAARRGLAAVSELSVPFFVTSHVAGLVFDVTAAAFAAGELQQAVRVIRRGAHASIGAEVAFRVMFFAGILALPASLHFASEADISGAVVFVIGVAIAWLGLLLRWWSFLTLGRLFTTVVKVSDDQPIVERGPYKIVRHPSYTGLIMVAVGVAAMIGNWAGGIVSVALVTIALVYRIRREERALLAARGTAYAEYMGGKARLIPHVW